MSNCKCSTISPDSTLIFCCAGASDLGAISERAARELMRDKVGKMFCLDAISAQEEDYLQKAKNACAILAIDGCKVHCAPKTLNREKIYGIVHLDINLWDLSKVNIHKVSDCAKELIAQSTEIEQEGATK